jgi:N-acetylmuramoyl-L-alanine amidase
MKKTMYAFLTAFVFIMLLPHVSYADTGIPLYLNGKQLISSTPAQIIKNTTMVPVRIVSEELGAEVGWNDASKEVTITKDPLKIKLQLGKKEVTVNGKTQKLDVEPMNVKGSTLLPLRFIAEGLGLKVDWENKARAVYLTVPGSEQPTVPTNEPVKDPAIIPVTVPNANSGSDSETMPENTPVPVPPLVNPVNIDSLTEIQLIQRFDDQVTIKGNGDLKPVLTQMDSANQLIIDFPKTSLSKSLNSILNKAVVNVDELKLFSNSVTGNVYNATTNAYSVASGEYISKIRYALFSDKPSSVRVIIDLKKKGDYQLIENKVNHQVVIAPKNSPQIVVIDPGHGGHDTGAISAIQKTEKEFNLSMGLKVAALLKKESSIRLVMTRSDDTFIELDDRAGLANNINASAYVSIHGNSYLKASHGVETYYYHDQGLALANVMHSQVVASTGFTDRGVKKSKFRVVSVTNMPSILIEVGYLSNVKEATEMYKTDFQDRVSTSIVAGIKQFLKIK